jgi:transketolase
VAHTIKGKGVSFMENNPNFHGTAPTPGEVAKALEELE